ncbi:LLM class flavin-dependent oxidoreductase [Streptomyces chiangmaiensis]
MLHPGRIDLGLGRSSGANQVTTQALQPNHEDFGQKFAELLAFFQGDFPDGHPYGSIIATPGRGNTPAIWLLGSGSYSAQLAGSLGLPSRTAGTSWAPTVRGRSRRITRRSARRRLWRSRTRSSRWA